MAQGRLRQDFVIQDLVLVLLAGRALATIDAAETQQHGASPCWLSTRSVEVRYRVVPGDHPPDRRLPLSWCRASSPPLLGRDELDFRSTCIDYR
jgi:hypothetical protein